MKLKSQDCRLSVCRPMRSNLRDRVVPGCVLMVAVICAVRGARAQDERRHKVPGLDKITSGASRLAFSGRVQSLDLQRSLLNVNTVQGGNTEVFPIKKSVRVEATNGGKLSLDDLVPGTTVLIYYEQRKEQRSVKEIVVLQSAPAAEKEKKPSPPS